jgi:hypothetical protein
MEKGKSIRKLILAQSQKHRVGLASTREAKSKAEGRTISSANSRSDCSLTFLIAFSCKALSPPEGTSDPINFHPARR